MKQFKRTTFKDIRKNASSECTKNLQERICNANSMAKIASTSKDRMLAYQTKDAALNHGLDVGLFNARSDERGRSHLLLVGSDLGRVHIPVHKLTSGNRQLDQMKILLGHRSCDAA